MKKLMSTGLLSILILSFVAVAQMPPGMMGAMGSQTSGVELPLRNRPSVITLNNGMQFLLIENHASPVIASIVVVRTGSRNETIEQCGSSHFLEHLLFNGTETRTQKQLYDEMDQLGGYNNANTTYDHTNFMILLGSANFDKGLEIQEDMLFHSTLPPDKFKKEKGIVIEEIGKDEDSESYQVEQFFNRILCAGTPYEWPILGSRQSIKRLTRDQVWDYYKTYYVPNNMTAMVIGDFRTPEMIELLKKVFGKDPPRTLPPKTVLRPTLRTTSPQGAVYVYEGEATAHHLRVTFPAPTRLDDDYHAFLVMTELLQNDLDQTIVNPASGVTSISATPFLDADFGLLNVDLTINPDGDIESIRRKLFETIKAFTAKRVDPEQVQAVVTEMRSEDLFNAERPHFYGMMKSDDLAQAGPYFLLDYQERLSAVAAEDVARAASDYLQIPEAVTMEYLAVRDAEKKGGAEAQPPTIRRQLPNGMTVVVRQNRESPICAVHFLFKHRSAYETMLGGKIGMVAFLHRILEYGPERMEKEEFQTELQKLGADVKFYDMSYIPFDDYYTTPEFSYVRAEVLDANYVPVIKLLAQDVMHPEITPETIEPVRSRMISLARRKQNSVRETGSSLFKSLLFGDSPLAQNILGSPDDIAGFSAPELRSFARLYFSPQNLILTVLTSADPNVVMGEIEAAFRSWTQVSPLPAVSYPLPEIEPVRKEIPGGKEQSFLAMGYPFKLLDAADKAPLTILNASLSNRLQFQLREREGLAYSLGSAVRFYGDWGVFYASMGTGPQNLERAETGILEQITRAATTSFNDQEVEKARNAYLGRMAMRTLTRVNRAYYLGLAELHGEALDYHQKWIGELQSVTLADVNRVAKQYLKTDGFTVAIVK